jgi:hypothetical protein
MSPLSQEGDDVLVRVFAKPRASKSELDGLRDGELLVRLAAPPVDGAANTELVKFLARKVGVAKRRVRVEKGEASRHKVVRIVGATVAELAAPLDLEG